MHSDLSFIHRFVPATSPNAPTLLLLHGTGGDENDLLELGKVLAPGAALLSPRGKVLENGMPRFFRRLAEGVFDEDDLKARTHELADFVAQAAAAYGFDANNVFAAGYSNGANIAAGLLLLQPEVLRAAILLHAMVPLVPEKTPDLTGTSVFLSAGRFDPMVTAANAQRLADMLQECGANVQLHWENGGHALSRSEIAAAQAWVKALEL